MIFAVGDLVLVKDSVGIDLERTHYVTVVHADGTLEIEGKPGRYMAHRFEHVLAGSA